MPKPKLILASMFAVLALAACGTETIDADDLESQLVKQLAGNSDKASASCPDDVEPEKGKKFDCELTDAKGKKVDVRVTLTSDDGGFDAQVVP